MRNPVRFARDAGLLLVAITSLAGAQVAAEAGAQAGTPAAAPPPSSEGPPSKTWEKALVKALKPTPGGVKYQLNVSESTIEATTIREFTTKLAEAGRNMVELRSGRSPGSFSWSLSTPWKQQMNMGRCEFKDLDVRITYDVDVVLMAGAVAQDSAARAWWDAQTAQVYAGHFQRLQLLRDSSRGLYQRLRLLSNSSCGELANIASNATRDERFAINDKMQALGARSAPLVDRE